MNTLHTSKYLKQWLSWIHCCTDPKNKDPNPRHQESLREYGHCPGCGEASVIPIKKDEPAIFGQDNNGVVIAAVVNARLYVLDYNRIEEIKYPQ